MVIGADNPLKGSPEGPAPDEVDGMGDELRDDMTLTEVRKQLTRSFLPTALRELPEGVAITHHIPKRIPSQKFFIALRYLYFSFVHNAPKLISSYDVPGYRAITL